MISSHVDSIAAGLAIRNKKPRLLTLRWGIEHPGPSLSAITHVAGLARCAIRLLCFDHFPSSSGEAGATECSDRLRQLVAVDG